MGIDELITEMRDDTVTIWQSLSSGALNVDRWQEMQARSLLVFHTAAYMMGRDKRTLTQREKQRIAEIVGEQVTYLNRFADVIDSEWDGGDLKAKWLARAQMYSGAIRATYWRGKTLGYNLPAYPGDGSSECLGNCGCKWDLRIVDEENGDVDATWVRGKDDSCGTCVERAGKWAPLQLRGNEQRAFYGHDDVLDALIGAGSGLFKVYDKDRFTDRKTVADWLVRPESFTNIKG